MPHDFFQNSDRLRLPHEQIEKHSTTTSKRTTNLSPNRRIKGEFLKGPIPLNWLSTASGLRGKAALAVGLAIWFEAGRRKSNNINLTRAICERFGVNRKAKYRGLTSLENANLISVVRRPRKNPMVTILEVTPASNEHRGVPDRDLAGPNNHDDKPDERKNENDI